jgi:hypothetical protein
MCDIAWNFLFPLIFFKVHQKLIRYIYRPAVAQAALAFSCRKKDA